MTRHTTATAILLVAWVGARPGVGQVTMSQPLPPGKPVAVRVTGERTEFALKPKSRHDVFLLVVGSAATVGRPRQITVDVGRAEQAEPLTLASERPTPAWVDRTRRLAEQLHRARRRTKPPAPSKPRPRQRVGQVRQFHVFNFTGNWDEPDSYTPITAKLAVLGRFCNVWCDTRDTVPIELMKLVVTTFDRDVLPTSRRRLGTVADVDGDGKFAILFTGEMTRLNNGAMRMGGMVIGQDFRLNYGPPLSNRCDMFYLNPEIRSQERLKTLVAHEFSHAVTMTHHALTDYLPGHKFEDEESWLNEAMAHVAENLYAYSWRNIAFRVNTYLNAPWRFQLVVRDFRDDRFWRLHGYRGAVYLFLRWCVDQYGQGILQRLQQTNLRGTENLEVTLRKPFPVLLRQWHLSLWLSHRGYTRQKRYQYKFLAVPGVLAGRYLLVGPCAGTLTPDSGSVSPELAPTSARYFLLRDLAHSAPQDASTVRVTAPADAALQISVVRLPGPVARVGVATTPETLSADAAGKVTMTLTLRETASVPVVLRHLSWEDGQEPSATNRETRLRPVLADADAIRQLFGAHRLAARGTLRSRLITVGPIGPGTRDLIFKVLGQDPKGRLVTTQHRVAVNGGRRRDSHASGP